MAKKRTATAEQAEKQGYYVSSQRIKSDVIPVDNETKFAWDDDDYEDFEEFIEYTEDELAAMEAAKEAKSLAEEAKKKAGQQEAFIEAAPERLIAIELMQSEMVLSHNDVLSKQNNVEYIQEDIKSAQNGIAKEQDDIKTVQGDIMLMLADVFGGA